MDRKESLMYSYTKQTDFMLVKLDGKWFNPFEIQAIYPGTRDGRSDIFVRWSENPFEVDLSVDQVIEAIQQAFLDDTQRQMKREGG